MKDRRRSIGVSITAVAGLAVGLFWIIAGQVAGSYTYWHYWDWQSNYVRWIAFASCPFIDIELQLLSFVVVPFLNAILYGLLAYFVFRFAKYPAIPAAYIVGAVVGVLWVIAVDAGNNGAVWPPHWESWPARITCPFIPLIGLNGLATGLVPLLNSLYGLIVYSIVSSIYRGFKRVFSL